jgi:hypothetical protein
LELNNYAYFGAFALRAIATLYIPPARVFTEASIGCSAVWSFAEALNH